MARKQEGSEVSRDALESFIWKATGWRGDATVIDSILDRVDDYTQAQCSRVVMRGTPAVDIKGYTERIRALEDEVAQEREVKDSALTTVTDLTRRLVAATEALVSETPAPEPQDAPEPVPEPLPSIVERIRVGELLELLTTATDQATAGLNAAAHTVDAISAISNALRAEDGMVKDIELSVPEPVAEPVAEPTREEIIDAEVETRITAAQARYDANRERIRALEEKVKRDMQAFPADWEGAPADILERIQEARADEGFQSRLAHSLDQNAHALERLADDGESLGPDDPDESVVMPSDTLVVGLDEDEDPADVIAEFNRAVGAGETGVTAPPEEDLDPIAALVAEVEAEIAAEAEAAPESTPVDPEDPGEKVCAKCGEVKSREAFYRDKQAADGYKGSCKECDVKRIREKREAQRGAVRESV